MDTPFLERMDLDIRALIRRALGLAWRYPRYWRQFFRNLRHQKTALARRAAALEAGYPIPAFMIASITRSCNLRCAGCYSHATAAWPAESNTPGRTPAPRRPELDSLTLAQTVATAVSHGVSFVLLAGGEPLSRRQDVLDLATAWPEVVFPVFTNGLLIDTPFIDALATRRNLIPVLSLEGGAGSTDSRRGPGVHQAVMDRLTRLKAAGIFYGISFTLTARNLDELTDPLAVRQWVRQGAGVLFYNEYTPLEAGTEDLCLGDSQRRTFLRRLEGLRHDFPCLFLAFPGDEDRYGGCLAAGRGFVHLAPDGRLEACPFAPFADRNIQDGGLLAALSSPLLQQIRENHHLLPETSGGCALWRQRDWVESLLSTPVGPSLTGSQMPPGSQAGTG